MSFGIDDGPGLVINCVVCLGFAEEKNLFSKAGLYIHTKPQEYLRIIPKSVVESLEVLRASRIKLTSTLSEFKTYYRFRPNKYDN